MVKHPAALSRVARNLSILVVAGLTVGAVVLAGMASWRQPSPRPAAAAGASSAGAAAHAAPDGQAATSHSEPDAGRPGAAAARRTPTSPELPNKFVQTEFNVPVGAQPLPAFTRSASAASGHDAASGPERPIASGGAAETEAGEAGSAASADGPVGDSPAAESVGHAPPE